MRHPSAAAALAALLLGGVLACPPARADNAMGYQLLTADQANQLPRRGGTLGLSVERAQRITDDGMTFDIMRVKTVARGSAGAKAGFKPGDSLVAVDAHVFPTIAAFADYIGSMQPGQQVAVDYIPAGNGPQQAQRASVTLGGAGSQASTTTHSGMSTGTKVAIGLGALLGCYELGCFSHKTPATQPAQ